MYIGKEPYPLYAVAFQATTAVLINLCSEVIDVKVDLIPHNVVLIGLR